MEKCEKAMLFRSLPDEWPEGPMPRIHELVAESRRKLVVLDDDHTGTQTVHNVPVLTEWSVEMLTAELQGGFPAFFLLTNSRSLPPSQAAGINREIGCNLKSAGRHAGVDFAVVSRSDSTLRGHFPTEVDALASGLDMEGLPRIVIPFFEEGGRYTIGDIHYVQEGKNLVPAAQTAYARDQAFGYRSSDLKKWVEEKTKGRIHSREVTAISLEDIRNGGPQTVAGILEELPRGSVAIVNAASYRDLEVFTAGLLTAEKRGGRFLYRTAASFVRTRVGILPRQGQLGYRDMADDNTAGGLFLVGSYVPKSTKQVHALLEKTGISSVELDVATLIQKGARKKELASAIGYADRCLAAGKDLMIYTSRQLLKGKTPRDSLDIGRRISESLIGIVQGIRVQPRYLVAKGGITASDIATRGLGIRRAIVTGQVLPGVPVWKTGKEARYPGMPYIVFPGNVGDADALAVIQKRLAAT